VVVEICALCQNFLNRPRRDNYPDFDIFIDDNHHVIEMTRKTFSDDKTYVTPDYKYSRGLQAPNIYHLKTTVSDLKDEDFVKAAQEYKARHAQKNIKENSGKKQIWKQRAVGYGFGLLSAIVLYGGY